MSRLKLQLDKDKGELRYKVHDGAGGDHCIAVFIPNSCGEVLLAHLEELILKAWTKQAMTVDRHRVEIQVRDYILFIRRKYSGIQFVKGPGLDNALAET